MKKLYSLVLILASVAPAAFAADSNPAQLPLSWYRGDTGRQTLSASPENLDGLRGSVDRLYGVQSRALANVADAPAAALMQASAGGPPDLVPWHLEYITTELAISAQGLLGALTVKGTPGIQLHWRHQGNPPTPAPVPPAPVPQTGLVVAGDTTTLSDIQAQLEPVLRTALASGKVQDADAMRQNVVRAATQLQALTQALDEAGSRATDTPFWVSGFRFDFTIDEVGHVFPIGPKGGDIRFRFEWKRLKRKTVAAGSRVRVRGDFEDSLIQFTTAMQTQLGAALAEADDASESGFRLASYRVGIGVTKKGSIGIAEGSVSLIGNLNFSADVKKPVVYPSRNLSAKEVQAITFIPKGTFDGYPIDPEQLRKGLTKAINIGNFFARGTDTGGDKWKIYIMKAQFDMTLAGDSFLAGLIANGTSDLTFYNQKF